MKKTSHLACRRCNGYKGTLAQALDQQTGETVAIFNPRQQIWDEHFGWSEDGAHINGRTQCGRATVQSLRLNGPEIIATRRRWRGLVAPGGLICPSQILTHQHQLIARSALPPASHQLSPP